MRTKYSYWVFRDVISEKDRNKIKRTANKSSYSKALTRKSDLTEEKKNDNVRNTDIAWSNDQYLYDLFCPFVHNANKQAGWKYDLDWFETVQIAKYKKNQHYSWHRDGAGDHFGVYPKGENTEGKVRKISLVACLSNGYVGGDLELALQEQDKENEILHPEISVGDVIVFPSYVFHRSTSISKGTKYSAAMWCLGPPFK
jgi:predicted 2-oxoglutarate/Fe(II)-dependent dioxygenase YbiX